MQAVGKGASSGSAHFLYCGAPSPVASELNAVPSARQRSGRILRSVFRTQKRPQKCEPQLQVALALPSLSPAVSRAAEEAAAAVDALALQCRSHRQVLSVWEALPKLQTVLTLRFVLHGSAVALEVCPDTFLREGKVRVHAHMFLLRLKRFRIRHAAEVLFLLSAANKPQAQGAFCRARSQSAAAGVYYLRCPKLGSVLSEGTLLPHVDFAVQPAWTCNLLAGGKMHAQAARQEFVRQAQDLPCASWRAWTSMCRKWPQQPWPRG